MFVSVDYGQSDGYRENWGRIRAGEAVTGEYQRLTKSGRELWMRSSYDPVVDDDNNLIKVVEVGVDITDTKVRNADFQGQLDAISKAQAVIEFHLDGTVITANDNFLTAMGYALDDVVGQHHRMFVDPEYASSSDYSAVLGQAGTWRVHRRRVQAHRAWRQGSLAAGVVQPDPRPRRQAVQGRQVRDRHHRGQGPQRRTTRASSRRSQGAGGDRVRSRRHGHHCERELPRR